MKFVLELCNFHLRSTELNLLHTSQHRLSSQHVHVQPLGFLYCWSTNQEQPPRYCLQPGCH